MKDLLYHEDSTDKDSIQKQISIEIIDEFEELLNNKNITIPDKDREWTEDEARIFGITYVNLEDSIISILDDYRIRKGENDYKIEHFRSKADMYIFALLYLDGVAMHSILKINRLLYKNKELATQWRNKIYNVVIQYQGDINKNEALKKLDDIYYNMIS